MNKRMAQKALYSAYYYTKIMNLKNGKQCLIPKSGAALHRMKRACVLLKCPEFFTELNNKVKDTMEV